MAKLYGRHAAREAELKDAPRRAERRDRREAAKAERQREREGRKKPKRDGARPAVWGDIECPDVEV